MLKVSQLLLNNYILPCMHSSSKLTAIAPPDNINKSNSIYLRKAFMQVFPHVATRLAMFVHGVCRTDVVKFKFHIEFED